MGGCVGPNETGDSSSPDLSQQQWISAKIGDNVPTGYCDYCGSASIGSPNCGNNNEFISNGDSGSKCTCRSMCTDACCNKQCKRVNYSGDITQCCTTGIVGYKDSNGIYRTCDPSLTYLNDKCNASLRTYCQNGTNLFDKPICKNWVTAHQTQVTQNGDVDTVINNVCSYSSNSTRPECACVVGAANIVKTLPSANTIPVQCMLNSCANGASPYKTINQMVPCNITSCSINLNDAKTVVSNADSFNQNFVQQCGNTVQSANNEKNTTGSTTPTGSTNPTKKGEVTSQVSQITTLWKKYKYYIIALIILIVLMVLLIIVLIATSGNNKLPDLESETASDQFGGYLISLF